MGSKCTTCACISKDNEFVSEIYLHENQTSVPNFSQETKTQHSTPEYFETYKKEIIKIQSF